MQHFYSSLLLLSLFATGGVAIAESSVESDKPNQYPEEFLQQYSGECMQTSVEEGLAESEAKTLCECTITKFQSQYELACLLYTSPSPRDGLLSRMPSSA